MIEEQNNTVDLNSDVVNDIIEKINNSKKDIKPLVEDIMGILVNYFDSHTEIASSELFKRLYLTTSGVIFSISQAFFENEEQYLQALEKTRVYGKDKIAPILTEIGDEDPEMLIFGNVMMILASAIDYIFWQHDFNKFADLRAKAESKKVAEEKQKQDAIEE